MREAKTARGRANGRIDGTGRLGGALAACVVALGLSGCYRATFIHPNTVRGEEYDEWNSFFLFGLVGHERFDAAGHCRDTRISSVRTGGNFGTGAVSVLTIGIYTPRKVYVTCASGEQPHTAGTEDAGTEDAGTDEEAR